MVGHSTWVLGWPPWVMRVTLGAFVLPHVSWMPWMAHRSGDRPGVALAKGSTQIIVTLWLWGTLWV